ncbi:MAG TPA: DUF3160 domain-containing protein [Chitinispirillaceae bacterium]|nr:DUF3160 domain-containing protein [Chitinispirillaceae bacterium]
MRLKQFLISMPILAAATTYSFDLSSYETFLEQNKNLDATTIVDNAKPSKPYFSEFGLEKSYRYLDSVQIKYGLTSTELDMLKRNNFVVTERKSFLNYGSALRDIFNKDLPVFLTTDAVLYTLHLSYDAILAKIEKTSFEPVIKETITKFRSAYPAMKLKYADSGLDENLADVDLYLAVAESMISGAKVPPTVGSVTRFDSVYNAIAETKVLDMKLFCDTALTYDFSQFTVRGHYVREKLENYFRTMMWLGRTELIMVSPKQGKMDLIDKRHTKRMSIDAALLSELLDSSGQKSMLDEMDKILSFFVGESDNLTVDEFKSALNQSGISSTDKLLSDSIYQSLSARLSATPEAGQKILSQVIMTDGSSDSLQLSVSFLLMGQRFIVDSYIFGNVIFDKIRHNGTKIERMMPDPLDAMYALGNDDAAPLLKNELAKYYYAPYLENMRYLMDSYEESFWRGSIYNSWINCLKKLNPSAYPSVEKQPLFMRSTAWHQKTLNTQLASWAQLRHDNLLYAKQSYTPGATCSYPHGYVEPYPAFYAEIATLARSASEKLKTVTGLPNVSYYYNRVAGLMDTLKSLAEKELEKQPFSSQDSAFMARMLLIQEMCGAPSTYGWYGDLIYDNSFTVKDDYTIADVHTQPYDEAGSLVGNVLHAAVGKINLGVFLTESPSDGYKPMAYAGPVVSYYQKVTNDFKRLTDEDWSAMVSKDSLPTRPDWVNSFLADNKGIQLPQGRVLDGIKFSTKTLPEKGNKIAKSFGVKNIGNAVSLTLPSANTVEIALYDLRGNSLGKMEKSLGAGVHTIQFPAASGVYTAVVKCNDKTQAVHVNKIGK